MKSLLEFLSSNPETDPRDLEKNDKNRFSEPPNSYGGAVAKLFGVGNIHTRAAESAKSNMDDWNVGKRKENVKACSDEKLIFYYKYCQSQKYEECCAKLEEEANRRGYTFTKLKL